jgi:hypothetical protein
MSHFSKYARSQLVVLCVAVLGVLLLTFWVGKKYGSNVSYKEADKVFAQMKFNLAQKQAENNSLAQQLAMNTQQVLLQEETLLNLRAYVEGLQSEHASMIQDANIYQSIMQDKSKTSNLTIRKFKLYATPNNKTVRYSLILSKIGVSDDIANGNVDLAVHGKLGDKLLSLPVKHFNLPEENSLNYNFKQFQELSGELSIPDNFIPTHVSVRVHPEGTSKAALEEWFNWGTQSLSDLS